MKILMLLFVKLTGLLPELVFFKRKTFFMDRHAQGRTIRDSAIIVSNHSSLLDFAMLLYLFPFRTLHFLMAEVLYKTPLLAWFVSCLGGVRVGRNSADMRFMGSAIDLLMRGQVLGIFPESRLSADGTVAEFKPSAAYIAFKSGAPVIPVYCKPAYGLFKRARVVVGEKIYLSDYASEGEPTLETLRMLSSMLRDRVLALKAHMELCEKTGVHGALDLHWLPCDLIRLSAFPLLALGFLPGYVRMEGAPHARRIRGGALVVSNHSSWLDPAMLAYLFAGRRIIFVAAEVLFENWACFMHAIRAIRIDRNVGVDAACLKRAADALRAGGMVGIFPEGRLSASGALQPFHSGAILMALCAKKPIIPVFHADRPKLFCRHVMMIGRPFDPAALLSGQPPTVQRIEDLTRRLEAEMHAMESEYKRRIGGAHD